MVQVVNKDTNMPNIKFSNLKKEKVLTFVAKKNEKRVATFTGFIAKLQQGLANNEGQFVYYATKKIVPFVELLKKQGLIQNYYILTTVNQRQSLGLFLSPAFDSRILVVYLKLSDKYAPALRRLKLFTVPSRAITISHRQLAEKVIAAGASTLYVLNTSKGLLTHIDALQHQIGGEIVCEIK